MCTVQTYSKVQEFKIQVWVQPYVHKTPPSHLPILFTIEKLHSPPAPGL